LVFIQTWPPGGAQRGNLVEPNCLNGSRNKKMNGTLELNQIKLIGIQTTKEDARRFADERIATQRCHHYNKYLYP
jgi:hypothetical protein